MNNTLSVADVLPGALPASLPCTCPPVQPQEVLPEPLWRFDDDPAYENNVSSILASLTINGSIGIACIIAFLILRRFTKQYELRVFLDYVTIKPPPLPQTGWWRWFGWVKTVLTTSDVHMLHSAGLDALVLQKSQALCIQLFLPVALIGCCVLMPLQISEAYENGDRTFSRLTMANIDPESRLMWAHWICVFLFLGWAMLLLEWHFREFVALRQFYLRADDGWNSWRELHMAEADGVSVHPRTNRLADTVLTAQMDAILKSLDADSVPPPKNWWRTKMAWLTSWTGTGTAEDVVELARNLTDSDANDHVITRLRTRTLSGKSIPVKTRGGVTRRHAVSAAVTAMRRDDVAGGHGTDVRTQATLPEEIELEPWTDAGAGQGDDAAPGARDSSHEPSASATGGAPEAPLCDMDWDRDRGRDQGVPGAQVLRDACGPLEEVDHLAAPRWWSNVDVVTTANGKLRRITPKEAEETKGHHILLAKPSVRYRKTVNTFDFAGRPVSVHAQQYAVLVTNVNTPVYPEYYKTKTTLGAGLCGTVKVKSGQDEVWMGQRYRNLRQATRAGNAIAARSGPEVKPKEVALSLPPRGASPSSNASFVSNRSTFEQREQDVSALLGAAEAMAALEAAEAGQEMGSPRWRRLPTPVVPPGRAAELWGRARTAMVEGRLRKLACSERYCVVNAVFSTLFPGDFDRVVPVFNFHETDDLMRQWDQRMGELELAEHSVRLGHKPRMVRISGARVRVERVEWLKAEVERLERAVLEARERALVFNSTPSFFALFRTQKAAAIAASCNIHPLKKQLFKVHPAPGPDEVNWESLWFTHNQRVRRAFFATPLIIFVVLFPVSMATSAMTQLNNAFCAEENKTFRWDQYCHSDLAVYKNLKAVLTGFVPSLLIQLWQGMIMPKLIYYAAQSEARHYSLSELDQRIGSIYFMWACLNFFLGGVVGSTALSRVSDLFVKYPLRAPEALGYALPASSKFFFLQMINRTCMAEPLRFLMPQPGVLEAWIRMGLSPVFKTLRDSGAAERTLFMRNALRSPRYGVEFGGNTCLVVLICFAFAVICPLVPLFGVAFFCMEWLFWRYQLIYGYQRKYESGGLFFPFMADRVLISACVMVAFTGCVMIIKSAWAQASLMWVIGFVSIYAYYRRTRDLYLPSMREMPLLVAQMAPRARIPSTVYVPPPLQQNGWLWYPEFLTCWDFFGMPSYSA